MCQQGPKCSKSEPATLCRSLRSTFETLFQAGSRADDDNVSCFRAVVSVRSTKNRAVKSTHIVGGGVQVSWANRLRTVTRVHLPAPCTLRTLLVIVSLACLHLRSTSRRKRLPITVRTPYYRISLAKPTGRYLLVPCNMFHMALGLADECLAFNPPLHLKLMALFRLKMNVEAAK